MSYDTLIDTKEIGEYRIKVYYDLDTTCPVKDWDMGASHLFEHLEHCRYWLSNDCDWKDWVSNPREYSLADLLQRIASDMVKQKDIIKYIKAGKVSDVRLTYNRHERQWELEHKCQYGFHKGDWITDIEIEPHDLKHSDYRMELLESFDEEELMTLIQECAKDFVIKEWSSSGYSQGDHMRGISYMSKEQFDKRCGFSPKHYKTWQEQAMAVIEGEIKCIETWAWGDVKGFVLEKKEPYTKVYSDGREVQTFEWEHIDSCWGYYMETSELFEEIISEHGLKDTAA